MCAQRDPLTYDHILRAKQRVVELDARGPAHANGADALMHGKRTGLPVTYFTNCDLRRCRIGRIWWKPRQEVTFDFKPPVGERLKRLSNWMVR